jgi:hypothetical protein
VIFRRNDNSTDKSSWLRTFAIFELQDAELVCKRCVSCRGENAGPKSHVRMARLATRGRR